MAEVIAKLRVTWLLIKQMRRAEQIGFHGKCPGCDKWIVTIPSMTGMIHVSRKSYDALLEIRGRP